MRLIGVGVLVLLPAAAILAVWVRLKWKERAMTAFSGEVQNVLTGSGWEPLGHGRYHRKRQNFKFELSTNPLLARGFTLRLAAGSSTLHDFELRRGMPVPEEFRAYAPLLERWASAGKMFTDCYAAGVVDRPPPAEDIERLAGLAEQPLERTFRGGTFTIREGFEKNVPQWHWRHDQRPKLPREARRFCVSYWTGSPLLNPPLVRLFTLLAEGQPMHYLSDAGDLSCLADAFGRQGIARRGALVELSNPAMPVAADLHLDGGFFGGLLVAKEPPGGFEAGGMPRRLFHDAALKVMGRCVLYARRLWDDEFSWYSGEYEIVSTSPLDVRGTVAKLASEMGSQVLDIDRRFNKRIVQPLEH
jgi:hypothetical protein